MIADWLRAWDSQGPHRTGTPGDRAGADWLAAEAERLGFSVTVETFMLSRIDPAACWVDAGGERIEGVPVFDAPPTPPEGIAGPLHLAPLSPWSVYTPEYKAMRAAGGHAGLVIATEGLLNAEQFNAPYGCPAIQIDRMPREAPARMVSFYTRSEAEARDIVVTIPGRDRARPPVVVMTPRSSWWQSTSERGGGLVCWLETLRGIGQPQCDVVFTANSGHELGHLGLDAFLERRPGWDGPDGALWVHYGANIGASGGTLSIHSADTPMRTAMRDALEASGLPGVAIVPADRVPNGETRDIHKKGGRYVTLVGTNPLFHQPNDRWPRAVETGVIARVASGAAAMVRALAG